MELDGNKANEPTDERRAPASQGNKTVPQASSVRQGLAQK